MIKVYCAGSYGAANLLVRPGMDEPRNDSWFELKTDEHGELRRIAREILVSFKEGAADVPNELGRYLVQRKLVSAEPQPFAPAPSPGIWSEAFPPPEPRKPPIAVGSPMTPEVARSQVTYLGERIRG